MHPNSAVDLLSITGPRSIHFPLQSRELLHDFIYSAFNKHSLSTHCISHAGQPFWEAVTAFISRR